MKMIFFEIIGEFIVDALFNFFFGILVSINNFILKLRGIETRSVAEIQLEKIKKKYEYKNVKLKKPIDELSKGTKGVVLEIINKTSCFVEFDQLEADVRKIRIKDIVLSIRESD